MTATVARPRDSGEPISADAATERPEPQSRWRPGRIELPMTAAGWTVAAIGVLAYVAGWRLGWVELMVVAAGAGAALLVAVPFVVGRLRYEVRRSIEPDRVMVGEPAVAVLDVRNPGGTPSRSRVIDDAVGPRFVRVSVPPLGAGSSHQAVYPLPTARRGVVTVGPAVIAKRDPLLLMRREVRHAEQQQLWVHPRYVALPPLPVGFAKDLEGPTSDASPAGDVAFHALREYQVGDDFRHIHWMSTARAGRAMVRHYVDNRRPQLLVVADDRAASHTPESFEVALEIAASLAVSSLLHREPVSVWTTSAPLLGRSSPGGRQDVLDRLSAVEATPDGDLVRAAMTSLRSEQGSSALVVVTGGVSREELTLLASQAKRHARVIAVRVWPAGRIETGTVPGARVLDVDSLDTFRRAWERTVR